MNLKPKTKFHLDINEAVLNADINLYNKYKVNNVPNVKFLLNNIANSQSYKLGGFYSSGIDHNKEQYVDKPLSVSKGLVCPRGMIYDIAFNFHLDSLINKIITRFYFPIFASYSDKIERYFKNLNIKIYPSDKSARYFVPIININNPKKGNYHDLDDINGVISTYVNFMEQIWPDLHTIINLIEPDALITLSEQNRRVIKMSKYKPTILASI